MKPSASGASRLDRVTLVELRNVGDLVAIVGFSMKSLFRFKDSVVTFGGPWTKTVT
jgi:hypothetical protein